MIRLLHLADAHLDAALGGFGKLADQRRSQILDAFRYLPDLAAERAVDVVFIAGDLFDGPRPPDATVAAVQETVRRFLSDGRHVFAVPGNHDAIALNPTLYDEALPGAVIFREPRFGPPASVTVGDQSLHVYGLAYDAAEEADPLSTFRRTDAAGLHAVLLHGSVPGAPHWEGGGSLPLDVGRLAALHADYIALGDYHRFRPPDEFDPPVPACYSGSLAAVDVSERGTKGAVLVELEEGVAPRVQLVSSAVPEVTELDPVDVTPFTDEAAIAEAVGERVPECAVPVIRLMGEPAFPLDVERVRVRLEERFGHAVVGDETRFYDSERLSDLASQKTIAGHVARLGLQRLEEAETPERRQLAERGLRIALRLMEVG
jgi:DNA repair exonuclease SbcCD nuclease subunit